MASRLQPVEALYRETSARRWLTWLAREMQARSVTVFLLEDLQPACLANRLLYFVYVCVSRALGVALALAALQLTSLFLDSSLGFEGETALLLAGYWTAVSVLIALGDAQWHALPRVARAVACVLIVNLPIALFAWYVDDESWFLLPPFATMALFVGGTRARSPRDDIQTVERLQWSWRRGRLGILAAVALVAVAVAGTWHLRDDKFGFLVVDITVLAAYIVGVFAALLGVERGLPPVKTVPNGGVRTTARHAALIGAGVLLLTGIPAVLLDKELTGIAALDPFPVFSGIDFAPPVVCAAVLAALQFGGRDVLRHFTLRLLLWLTGALPLRLVRFLDYAATDLRLLQKVGGGYIFVHRMLLEHFAETQALRDQRRLGITALSLALLSFIIPAVAPINTQHLEVTSPVLPDARLLRHGDLIFRAGTGFDSRLIMLLDGRSSYSHVGLIDLSEGMVRVVHIEPTAEDPTGHVRREPLVDFLAPGKSNGFAIYRVQSPTPHSAMRAVQTALSYLSSGVTFDHRLDLDTAGAMYCSELVVRAYRAAGIDLSADAAQHHRFTFGGWRVVSLMDLARAPGVNFVTFAASPVR